jgi:hypothetical protein
MHCRRGWLRSDPHWLGPLRDAIRRYLPALEPESACSHGRVVAISASAAKSPEDTDYARNARHGQGAGRGTAVAGILEQAGPVGGAPLWMPDSKPWRPPRRWQPLTRFDEPRDQELRNSKPTWGQPEHLSFTTITCKQR